jgi:predicted nucleic acid-binding protein
MKEFFDTSVLIGAFWRGHPQHEASLKLLSAANKRKSACAMHTLAESTPRSHPRRPDSDGYEPVAEMIDSANV